MSYNNAQIGSGRTSFGDVLSQTLPLTFPSSEFSPAQSPEKPVFSNYLTGNMTLVTKKLFQLTLSEGESQGSPPPLVSQVSGHNLDSSQCSSIKREHSAYQSPKNIDCVTAAVENLVEKDEEILEAVVKVPFQLHGLPPEMVPQAAPRKKNEHLVSEELKIPLLFFGQVPTSIEKVFVEQI